MNLFDDDVRKSRERSWTGALCGDWRTCPVRYAQTDHICILSNLLGGITAAVFFSSSKDFLSPLIPVPGSSRCDRLKARMNKAAAFVYVIGFTQHLEVLYLAHGAYHSAPSQSHRIVG